MGNIGEGVGDEVIDGLGEDVGDDCCLIFDNEVNEECDETSYCIDMTNEWLLCKEGVSVLLWYCYVFELVFGFRFLFCFCCY